MPDIVTRADLERALMTAAVSWSVHHSPIVVPYDKSPYADQLRAKMRDASETNLHAAVNALLAEYNNDASCEHEKFRRIRHDQLECVDCGEIVFDEAER